MQKTRKKIKMRRRLNRGLARVPLKRVKEARKIAKKMCARRVARVPLKKVKNLQKIVRAACGARTSEKSEGGKYFIMHC
jgi:16S rRNA C1402 N4-methylase RsmH